MFCMKCGHKLIENSKFCINCGERILNAKADTCNSKNQDKTNVKYSMYEVFDYSNTNWKKASKVYRSMSDSLAKLMYKNHPDFLNSYESRVNNPSYKTIYKYVITDRSIILEGTEYSYEQLKVICPDKGGTSIDIKIEEVKYGLYRSNEDIIRLYYSLMILNQVIRLNTLREKLQYIWMGYCLLDRIRKVIFKQSSIVCDKDNNKIYNELWTEYQSAYKSEDEQIDDYYKGLIIKYNYVSNVLNDFFKEENPIADVGYNRHPETLAKIIDIMTDSDTDMNKVVNRYNRKVELEKQQEAEYYERRRMEREMSGNSGDGFFSRTLSTAAGVAIGNKISNRKNTKKETSFNSYYTCPIGCKFGYCRSGVHYCRLSTAWGNSPEPEKCGYGNRIR